MAKFKTNEENLLKAVAEAEEEVIINGKHTVIEYGVNGGKTIEGTLLKANSRDGTALVKTATHIVSVTNVQSMVQELSNE